MKYEGHNVIPEPGDPSPKTDGPSNVAFFVGLEALPLAMEAGLGLFNRAVKVLCAEAYMRGFTDGRASK